VVCATQLGSWSKNYGDDATDADLLVASHQFDIASESVRDTSVTMCKTTERPCASPLSEEEFEELIEEKLISEENCRQGDMGSNNCIR